MPRPTFEKHKTVRDARKARNFLLRLLSAQQRQILKRAETVAMSLLHTTPSQYYGVRCDPGNECTEYTRRAVTLVCVHAADMKLSYAWLSEYFGVPIVTAQTYMNGALGSMGTASSPCHAPMLIMCEQFGITQSDLPRAR